jgi:hypothetical protein
MMEDEIFESLGPLLYAATISFSTFKKAYGQASEAYKTLTGNDATINMDAISKIFSSGFLELEKTSEISAEDFLKKYRQLSMVLSVAKKVLC